MNIVNTLVYYLKYLIPYFCHQDHRYCGLPESLYTMYAFSLVQRTIETKITTIPIPTRTNLAIVVLYIKQTYCIALLFVSLFVYNILLLCSTNCLIDSLINLPHFVSISLSLSLSLYIMIILWDIFFINCLFFFICSGSLRALRTHILRFYNFLIWYRSLPFRFVSLISTCRLPIAHISVCEPKKQNKKTFKKNTTNEKRKMFTN